ncbi:MAG: formate dehydrogenase beta subunit, partial [Solirubrobacteraceae bacterium]|nr:formate dehydrogenase beta subunit [Solirubrobacteraceae bacterium]
IYGLWGKPTLMNSVETFADVPIILDRGAEWWKAQGVNGATGLKFFAVSGHVERPDVYCVRAGTTTRELVELAGGVTGGREIGAFQPGGASSNFLGAEHLDVPLDWKPLQEAGSMLGSGALTIVAEGTNMLAAGTNVLRFFRNESCGKCVPCRVGSNKAHTMLTDLVEQGKGAGDVPDEILQLEATLRMTSICGLGQVAMGPLLSVLGLERGGAAAREHPKDPEDTEQ